MAIKIRIASALLGHRMSFAAFHSLGAEPTKNMRVSIRILASQETPAAKLGLRGFCAASEGGARIVGNTT